MGVILLAVTCSIFVGCRTKKETAAEEIKLPSINYSPAAMEMNDGEMKLYKLEGNKVLKMGSTKDVSEAVYNLKSGVTVFVHALQMGNELEKNEIVIEKNGKQQMVKNFYHAENIKLSPDGTKLVFRIFEKDSYESAKGLVVYDIDKNQVIDAKMQVLVSGSLFEWLDDNNLVYYGVKEQQKGSAGIYKLQLSNMNESALVDEKMEGYCTGLQVADKGLIFLTKKDEASKMFYYSIQDGKSFMITENVTEISKGAYDPADQNYYMLAQGKDEANALFTMNLKSKKVQRITFDFPKEANPAGGLGIDNSGNVYFSGSEGKAQVAGDIFYYDVKSKSTNLISTHEGQYHIFSENIN